MKTMTHYLSLFIFFICRAFFFSMTLDAVMLEDFKIEHVKS